MPPRKRQGKLTARRSDDAQASPAQRAVLDDDHRRGLLQLRVPLAVTVVTQRQSIAQLSNLAPGTILRFDKPCSAPLELQVAGRTIARGQCVRQGDRLGLLLGERTAAAARA